MAIILPGSAQGNGVELSAYRATQLAPVAATRTQVVGTAIKAPPGGFKAGTRYVARFNAAKTAAGVATSTIDVSIGAAGTVADTARVSFVKPAGTAAADEGLFEVVVLFRSISATGILVGEMTLIHNLAATGHAQIPVVAVSTISATFDNTAEELYIATNITTGAADVITIEQAYADLYVPSNG